MADVVGNEVVLETGDGCWVWDERGSRYLDATASLWYCNVGYGRRELVEAAAEQMLRLPTYSTFGVYANRPALELAERIARLGPTGPSSAVFFTDSGSESVETAAKLARRYWQVAGAPERTIIVSREESYHGMNAFGTSLAGIKLNREGWGELVSDVIRVPANSVDALAEIFELHRGRVAAFIGEPVIGAGGVYPPEDGYWARVASLCHEHDVLLIADEVVTGFGRLGKWFACERYGITPDLVVGAKGVTSGYMPLGVVICGERVRNALWDRSAGVFRHGYTYSGHATACAVGLRNLDIIELERLVERVQTLEPILERHMATLNEHPLVAEVRAVGLLAAIELKREALDERPGLADEVVREARNRGVLVRHLVGKAIQISPPFVIGEGDIAHLAEVLAASLDAVSAQQLASS